MLANLISNALHHTPADGTVLVSAVAKPDRMVEVAVSDTGSGIEPELVDRAFDRFAKGTGSTGSGLGLAIARDLVEAQGGQISIDGALDRGTRVRFTLPVA